MEEEFYLASLETDDERRQAALELEKERFEEDLARRLENQEITEEEMLAIKAAYGDMWALKQQELLDAEEKAKKAAAQAEVERKQAEFDFKVQTIASGFKVLADALGEESKLGKAAAIASIIADAAVAIIGTWRGYSKLGPFGTVAAIIQTVGIGVAAGVAISQVNNTKSPTSSGGGVKTVPNQNPPSFADGGWIGGYSHLEGGTMVEAENGEFIVNKATMASPYGAMITAANAEGANGNISGGNGGISREEAVQLINAQKVYVVDSDITTSQKKTEVREKPFTI